MSWGSNDAGVPWQVDPAYEADFSTEHARGRIANRSAGVFRTAYLPYTLADVDLTVNVQTDQVALGDWINATAEARYVDSANYLSARLEFRTSGNYSVSLYQVVDGSSVVLGTFVNGAYSASSPINLRLQVRGENARAKAWPVATPEPDHWQVGRKTSHLTPGRIGLGSVLSSGNTNVDPEVSFGSLVIPNPQQFRVIRSVNGVRKGHLPGADVRLAHPSVLAL